MNNDELEFLEAADNFDNKENNRTIAGKPERVSFDDLDKTDEGKAIGSVTQYARYGSGYKATQSTIPKLPAGSYDICMDSNGLFFEPTLPPAGLLLELPEMRSEHVISLVDNFWNSEKDYKEGNEFVHGGALYKAGVMIYGPPGCHAKGTGVLMFDGTVKKVENIVVGDLLMGPDSLPREVLELKRGKEEMIKVVPTKGEEFTVNKSHILHLTPTHANETVQCPINIKVSDLMEKTAKPFAERFKLTRTGVEFPKKKLLIPPYILGVWLGDGTSHIPSITSMDSEIIDAWKEYANSLELEVTESKQRINSKANCYTISTQTSFGGKDRNKATENLKKLNLLNNKHIPADYLTSDREDRLQLLAGLIDTDGHTQEMKMYQGKKNGFDFISKWEHLANEVVFLSRSLGFAAYVTKCEKGCYVGKEEYFTGEYYRVSISGDLDTVPVLLKRKKCDKRLQIKNVLRTGFTFEKMPEDDFYGFTLNKDHLYLTSDFMIHHNSGKSCTIKLVCKKLVERGGTVFFAGCNPNWVNTILQDFSRVEPNRKCIIILEDIDSLINSFGESSYLEMLDSAKTINNALFIATTNYPERLDPRIYNRPGRFSQVVKIGLPTAVAREAFLRAILKDHRDVDTIVKHSDKFTIDHLSSLVNAVYREKKDLMSEINRLRTLFRLPKSGSEGNGMGLGQD